MGLKKYDCVVKKVDVLPSSEESITKYRLQVPIQGVNVGVHMDINIPYSSVLIPGKFEDKGQILIKKSNSKAFKKRKINIIRTMGLKICFNRGGAGWIRFEGGRKMISLQNINKTYFLKKKVEDNKYFEISIWTLMTVNF